MAHKIGRLTQPISWFGLNHFFYAELFPERYWWEPSSLEKMETISHATLPPPEWSCVQTSDDESHFNVSLIVKDNVTETMSITTTLEERGEPKQNRTEALLPNDLLVFIQRHWSGNWCTGRGWVTGRVNCPRSWRVSTAQCELAPRQNGLACSLTWKKKRKKKVNQ